MSSPVRRSLDRISASSPPRPDTAGDVDVMYSRRSPAMQRVTSSNSNDVASNGNQTDLQRVIRERDELRKSLESLKKGMMSLELESRRLETDKQRLEADNASLRKSLERSTFSASPIGRDPSLLNKAEIEELKYRERAALQKAEAARAENSKLQDMVERLSEKLRHSNAERARQSEVIKRLQSSDSDSASGLGVAVQQGQVGGQERGGGERASELDDANRLNLRLKFQLEAAQREAQQAHFELLRMRAEGDQGKDAGETGDKLSTVTPQKAEAAGGGGTPSPFKPGGMVTPVAAYPLTPSPVVETPAQGQHFNSPATPAVFNQQPVTPVVTSASIGSPESTHIPPAPPPRNNCRGGGAGGEGENPGKIRGEGVDTLVGDILCDAKALVRGRWPVSKRGPHPLSAAMIERNAKGVQGGGGDPVVAAAQAAVVAAASHAKELETRLQKLVSGEGGNLPDKGAGITPVSSVSPGDTIDVVVVGAAHLPKANLLFGTIDPYFVLKMGSTKVHKTRRLKNTVDPVYDESFSWLVGPGDERILVTLKDQQTIGSNRAVAECSVQLSEVAMAGPRGMDRNFTLLYHGSSVRGLDGSQAVVHLQVTHRPANSGRGAGSASKSQSPAQDQAAVADTRARLAEANALLEQARKELASAKSNSSVGAAVSIVDPTLETPFEPFTWNVTVHRAQHLPQMDVTGKADPYVVCSCGGDEKKTRTIKTSLDPEFGEVFEFAVKDEGEELLLTIMDWDRLSKDEVIGQVRIPCMGYVRQAFSGALPIVRPNSTKMLVGKDGSPSTITVTLSSSLSTVSSSSRPPTTSGLAAMTDNKGPVTVGLKFDQDFDSVASTPEARASSSARIAQDLSKALRVPLERLIVLNIDGGSVIVDVNILPPLQKGSLDLAGGKVEEEVGEAGRPSPIVAAELLSLASSGKVSHIGGGGLAACTIYDRRGQIEAENAYLLRVNELCRSKFDEIEKLQKMKSSEAAFKTINRWVKRHVYSAFSAWASHVEMTIALRAKEGEMKGEMDAVLKKVAEEREREQAEYEAKRREIEGKMAMTQDLESNLGKSIAGELKELEAGHRARVEEMERKAKEAEEAAKAEIDAAREAGGEAARKEAEEHTRKAREAAERQHGLERKLRMELARLKAAGGGPVLHARIEKAQNLPKVDSVGWIDAYLVMRVGGEEHKTKIRKRERDPVWDEEFDFALEQSGGGQGTSLELTLFDWEMMRNDRPIGSINIKVSDVVEGRVEGWFELVDEVGEKVCGQDGAPSTVSMSVWYEEGSSAEAERLKQKIEDEKEAAEREEAEAEKARQEAAMAGVQINASEEREKKAQARNLLPPYKVTCTVKGARDLPKMDSFGKCDCYVIVSCGGVEKKTNRVDKNYDPDFEESFTFDVAHRGASLSCQVFDFDRMSKDEVIGSVTVPVGKLTSAEPLEGMYKILGKSGLGIKGHSGKDSRLLLSITAQAPPSTQGRDAQCEGGGAAVAEVGNGAAAAEEDFEPFLLRVKVVEGKHMPKMDAFGKCDAYCILSTGGGDRAQTKAKKNTYSPVWGEDFELSVEHARAELIVSVYDWDLTGKDDYIGNCHVPIEQLIGEEGRREVVILTEESDAVMGHDGEPCVIVLEACRKEIGAPEEGGIVEGAEDEDSCGEPVPLPYDIVVDLRSARHLPKMDRMGTADPYVIVSLGGQEQRTNRINGTLNPDWNEKVQLQVTSPAQSLVVTVMDWDRLSKDKIIGQARVPAGKLCPGGLNRTKLRLVSESGMPITGHDGQDSTISLRLTPRSISTPEALPEDLVGAHSPGIDGGGFPVAGGGGGLEGGGAGGGGGSGGVARVRIVGVSHLPKMDRFGSCDPYVMLIVADPPQRHQTSVVKKTYNASWETDNVFDVALGSVEEELVVRVMDWDLVGDDELVGTAHIPSRQLLLDEADMPATRLVTLQTAKGVPVTGKDGKPTSVTLEVSPVPVVNVAEEGGTEEAREEEAVHGTLHVSIISACGLPKMDTWTHKADPYLVVECRGDGGGGGVVHKTKTRKNTLSPTWNESCRFDCIAGKSQIHINMHDYNRASADEFMGRISIPVVSKPTPPTDYPLTGTLAGGETCRGTVRLSTTFTPGPAPVTASLPPGGGGDSGGGRLDIKVTVNGVRSLPKMDMTGKCDPYVVVTVGGESRETGHKKNVYEATWGEQDMDATFFFSADAASPGEVVASVFDWNRVSQPTLIGTTRIRVEDLAIGVASSSEYAVCGANGEHIKGHDGGATFVGLEVLVQKAEEDGQGEEGGSGEGGMWDVRVCVKRCEHMPKMDSLLGKCDPMVTVRLGAKEQATKPLKNRYEGNWKDENFLFTTRSLEDSLLFTAWDFDTVSKNDFIGLKRMGLAQFDPRQSDDVAQETEMMMELVDKQGSPVKGHDGQNSLVYVSVQVSAHKAHMGKGYIDAVTRGLDVDAVCDGLADKPWKLKVSVISGEHLPKTDTYGLCDPFVTLSIDGGDTEQKTSVIKNTLSPYWDEHFVFNPVKCAMRGEFLTLVVWDQDALGQEVVGLAKIPLGAIAAAADVEWPPMSLHTKQGEPVFDARGFESTLQLKFEVDIPKEGASKEIVDAAEVQREEVKSAVCRLEELCGEFEAKEGEARMWLLSSDAKLDALASMCEQVSGRIRAVEGAKEAEIEGLLERVDLVRSSLNVACHEAFSASQVQMALGIGVTVVQVALLKLFLIWG